jgi:hypothetical protein
MAIQTFTAGQVLTAAQMNSLQANDYNQTVSTKTDSYTLVAADKGTRVVMNKATATTITVNTSLFSAGDTLFIQNIGAGTCTITAGTATVTTAGSLALSTWAGGTLYFTSASAAIFFSGSSPAYGTATGGIGAPTAVTISGVNYEYLTFNSTGTLTVTKAGFFDYLAIGGGQGSARIVAGEAGGGGGAGQVVIGSIYLDTNQTITIGAGGAFYVYTSANFVQAGNTTIAATAPFAVGALGNVSTILANAGQNSGTYIGGGNGTQKAGTIYNLTETIHSGYQGGNGTGAVFTNAGGGGGQSGRGQVAAGATTGGAGGTGVDISLFIGGSASYRATGGGGGGSTAGGAGGNSSASSNAGSTGTTPGSASANSGSGGGGGVGVITTGNGGSGVVFIRYRV